MEEHSVPFTSRSQYHSVAPAINKIRDWLWWSIVNVFVGWGGGFLPLIFSIICRSNKRQNDLSGARTMSTLALVFNIFATLFGIVAWILLIVRVIFFYKTMSAINQIITTHQSY